MVILSASDNVAGDIITQDIHLYAADTEVLGPNATLVAYSLQVRNMGKSMSGEYAEFEVLSNASMLQSLPCTPQLALSTSGIQSYIGPTLNGLEETAKKVAQSLASLQAQEEANRRLRIQLENRRLASKPEATTVAFEYPTQATTAPSATTATAAPVLPAASMPPVPPTGVLNTVSPPPPATGGGAANQL